MLTLFENKFDHEFGNLHKTLSRFFGDDLSCETEQKEPQKAPFIYAGETEKELHLYIFAPGIDKSLMDLTLEGETLEFTATKSDSNKEETKANGSSKPYYSQKQRFEGKLYRTFKLPETINKEKVSATYENGIVKIVLEKLPEVQPKQIKIQVK